MSFVINNILMNQRNIYSLLFVFAMHINRKFLYYYKVIIVFTTT